MRVVGKYWTAGRFALCAAFGLLALDQEAWSQDGHGAAALEIPQDTHYTLGLVVENDVFAGTDRNYTNGLRLVLTMPFLREEEFGRREEFVADFLLRRDDGDLLRKEVAIGHSIFTPEDRLASEPLPDQHPYAAWLYVEGSVQLARVRRRILDTLTLQLGVIGPSAQGEFVQNNFHDLIGDDELQGWEHQLKDEVGVVLSFDRKSQYSLVQFGKDQRFGIDVVHSGGFSVGNVLTLANMGGILRIGYDLEQTFGPPRVRPALGGATFFSTRSLISGFFFLGVEGRAVGRNIFLDGNTWQDSLSVKKETIVADFQSGFVLQYGDWHMTWTAVARTKEFEMQSELQRFGAVSVVRRF